MQLFGKKPLLINIFFLILRFGVMEGLRQILFDLECQVILKQGSLTKSFNFNIILVCSNFAGLIVCVTVAIAVMRSVMQLLYCQI